MKRSVVFTATVGLVLFYSSSAYAYIDPGTGSYMLQIIMAGIVGAVVTVKMYYHRIRAAISSLFGGSKPNNNSSDDE